MLAIPTAVLILPEKKSGVFHFLRVQTAFNMNKS